jgi:hypothetical protein
MQTMNSFTHSMVRHMLSIICLLYLSLSTKAQMPAAITVEPANATAFDELTLTFDPELACFESGSLAGLPSIGMFSGVTIYPGNIWQYVIPYNGTGVNGQAPVLMPTGDGKYSITYTPSEFYGIPIGTIVTQICAVFNNGTGWDQDGRDFDPGHTYCIDFFIPLNYNIENPAFHFNLNMNKMIYEGNFDPSMDEVYIVMDDIGTFELLDLDGNGIYEGTINEGLEAGTVYDYQFRINADQYEDIIRNILAVNDLVTVDVWWNNDILGNVTFIVDMSYQILLGNFNPQDDFVDVAGSMNYWNGSGAMLDIGNGQYSVSSIVYPGIFEYKFRINGDWSTCEFPNGGPNRMAWYNLLPLTMFHYYDDYNPDTWPATFNVDMNAEIAAGHFDPDNDFLDMAGTMNNWEGNYFLFERYGTPEGVYTINTLIDKNNPYMEFKFRINGDWDNAEFQSGPNRTWLVQDTAGGLVNLYECVYNVPYAPAPPVAYDLFLQGNLVVGNEVTGMYTYYDPNGDPEGESQYQWYHAVLPDLSYAEIIEGAVYQNYTITSEDLGKYLIFEVTPVSATGSPAVGEPAYVISVQVITTGLNEPKTNPDGSFSARIYPNPVSSSTTLVYELKYPAKVAISIYDQTGLVVGKFLNEEKQAGIHQFNWCAEGLPAGIYYYVIHAGSQAVSGKIVVLQ